MNSSFQSYEWSIIFFFCKPQHLTDGNNLWPQYPLEDFLLVSYPKQLNTQVHFSIYACNFRNPCCWVLHNFKARQAKRKRTIQNFPPGIA